MSNFKGNLSENNQRLIEIKRKISELGSGNSSGGNTGGSSGETCTVTIKIAYQDGGPSLGNPTFYYVDATTHTIQSISTKDATIVVPLNSIIAITGWTSMSTSNGSSEQIFYGMALAAYSIYGDCDLVYAS